MQLQNDQETVFTTACTQVAEHPLVQAINSRKSFVIDGIIFFSKKEDRQVLQALFLSAKIWLASIFTKHSLQTGVLCLDSTQGYQTKCLLWRSSERLWFLH